MRHAFCITTFVVCIAFFCCANQAAAQDAVLVTVTNGTGTAAGRLDVTFSGSGSALTADPLTVFTPLCPTPSVSFAVDTVSIDWGADCVAPGGSVTFIATTPNGPLAVTGGAWFATGGVPLLGPIDTSPLTMYGTDGGELFTIDAATATTAPIGTVGAFGVVADIDCSTDCVMYGGTGAGDGDLVTIDQTSGAEALIGNNGVLGESNGALEWVGSTLYAVISGSGSSASTLVTLDPGTGAATSIGATGIGPIGGLAYDSYTGVMYGVEAGSTFTGNLVRIDLATGAATIIGPTGFSTVSALEFDPVTRVLYGAVGSIDPDSGSLIVIDTATGAASIIGPTSYSPVTGITFCGGKVVVQRIGPGGILLPNGALVVWRQRVRYQPVGLIYSPWFKPPGSCWMRWCCFVGQICLRDINLYVYKTWFGRVLGLRRCIPVVRGRFIGVRGAGWGRQRRTQPPPPDQPQIPIGGPIPNRPPLPIPIFGPLFGGYDAYDRLTFSDDGGTTHRDGVTTYSTFADMLDAITPIVPGDGTPPPIEQNFLEAMQEIGPGYCDASVALLQLVNELQLALNAEPNTWLAQVQNALQVYHLAMNNICAQMNGGLVTDPIPFFDASAVNANLANLMLNPPPLPPDATPDSVNRLANAADHFDRCALGFQIAGDQVALDMFDGNNDTVERDTFYWHVIQHYPSELAMLAAALDRHVRLILDVDTPTGWGFEATEPIQVEIIQLDLVSVQPIVVTPIELPVSHNGDLYIRRPDRPDGNIDEDQLFRVRVKFPTMLSRVVDVPPGDGLVLPMPPMIPGDVDGDNCITPLDLQLVNDTLGQGGEFAPEVPSSDVNFDGIVDAQDQLIVQSNQGLCGQAIDDCDYNGVSDAIDIANGDQVDCNNNGIPDLCEIESGIAPDENGNGVPDVCDCPADITGGKNGEPDGIVNLFDLLLLLDNWGTNGAGANIADPPDDIVNLFDLLAMLDAWGDCE